MVHNKIWERGENTKVNVLRGLLDFVKKHLPCRGENGSSAAFKQSTGTLMVCNGLV